ncbi:MAG: 50S ribosomal protein L23 [Candidatus Marinimicrobia bacterium]|nr:50S ribosomal protein L23 [Candidatus Neomarinimicrobiota bacterium]
MAIFDVFKREKQKGEERLKRPPKGAFKRVEKYSKDKQDEVVEDGKKEKGKNRATEGKSELASFVISAPHITEKSTILSEGNVYVFRVTPRANKITIKKAVKELYGFDPIRINIVNIPAKTRSSRGRKGVRSGYKKAMVYLKEGDQIELS